VGANATALTGHAQLYMCVQALHHQAFTQAQTVQSDCKVNLAWLTCTRQHKNNKGHTCAPAMSLEQHRKQNCLIAEQAQAQQCPYAKCNSACHVYLLDSGKQQS